MKNPAFDVEKIKDDFPILNQTIHGHPLVYLDNAATTQKPSSVINALQNYYLQTNANVHRGIHQLAEKATQQYEEARLKVKSFINAKYGHECVFVHGATEGINVLAQGFSRSILKPDDEIIISQIEHHSNIVPWQMACQYTGAKLRVIACNDQGELDLHEYANLLNDKTKLVAIAHVSNVLGTINPIQEMIQMAHDIGVPILIDGAQAAPHIPIDVQSLDCDFYVFSGHKMYGPTGVGVLYGKSQLLENLPPLLGGGEMIKSVSFAKTLYNDLPFKFEAGTPPIAQVIGLGSAIDYLEHIDVNRIHCYEQGLLKYATQQIQTIPGIKLIGTAKEKACVLSFLITGIHAHDVGTVLDNHGIAVRTGKLCAEPTLERFGISAVVRASFGVYNTMSDVDKFIAALQETRRLFRVS